VSHVASDWKSQGLNRLLQQGGKQTYTSASPKTTPFDSILDQTSRPAPEPRTQRAPDDNSPRADRSQRAKPAARPDHQDRTARPDEPSDADTPAKAASTADTAEADSAKPADAKATDSPADTTSAEATTDDKKSDPTPTDDITAAGLGQQQTDAKAVDGAPAPVAVLIDAAAAPVADAALPGTPEEATIGPAATATIAATTGSIATATPGAATATETDTATAAAVLPPVPGKAAKPPTAAANPADAVTAAGVSAETDTAEALLTVTTPLAAKAQKAEKTDLKSENKAEADKKAGSSQPALKPIATPDPEQTANAEPAKDPGAHVRTEATANSHRGNTADRAVATSASDGKAPAAAPKTPDLLPPPGLTVPAHSAPAQAAAVPIAAAAQPDQSDPAVPIANVAFEITGKVLSGRNQFDIRLDPPDLGRIHVRLDVDRDGNVITHMVADRTDTLDMLRKDTAGLERALQDAGLKTSDNSLQFSLRDQQANQQQRNSGGESAHIVIEDEQLAAIEPAQRNYARYNASAGGLDIRV
jgi:chemotaxis protein MotD